MEYIFTAIIFVAVVAAMLFIKSMNLGAGLTIALVAPLILLAIYGLARVQPRETATDDRK
jgi:uncharacterized membrane protein YobD (UPF0266 family)